MAFRKKSYQEIVEDVLTDLTGQVVGEEHTYQKDRDTYLLDRAPVRPGGIVSVRGTRDGAPHTFTGFDYQLEGNERLAWEGDRPDPDTIFYVAYNPVNAGSPITDRNVGSVTRTIVEAFSREVATLYAQLEKAYLSAFVDTAEGTALDSVVSLLGIERIRAGRAVGVVELSRGTPAPGDITIPLGTLISDAVPNHYETVEERTLRQGQTTVEVPIRAASEDVLPVSAGDLNLVPQPVVGIERVINFEATVQGTKDESDEALRARAKVALYGAGKATADAIRFAVLEQGVKSVVIHDMPRGVPGELDVIVDYGGLESEKKDLKKDLKKAVDATRAAGIRANLKKAKRINLALSLEATLGVPLLEEEEALLRQNIQHSIATYVATLKAGEPVLGNQIVTLAMADPRVQNVSFEIEAGDEEKRGMSNGKVSMGRMEKADVAEKEIKVDFNPASLETPPAEEPEEPTEKPAGPAPIQVEATITAALIQDFVDATGNLAEAQSRARVIVETKVQAYFAELFAGDEIAFDGLWAALASDRYGVREAELRHVHTLDGLVITLNAPGETDHVREGEQVASATVTVDFE